jgi:hypothetical protein
VMIIFRLIFLFPPLLTSCGIIPGMEKAPDRGYA